MSGLRCYNGGRGRGGEPLIRFEWRTAALIWSLMVATAVATSVCIAAIWENRGEHVLFREQMLQLRSDINENEDAIKAYHPIKPSTE